MIDRKIKDKNKTTSKLIYLTKIALPVWILFQKIIEHKFETIIHKVEPGAVMWTDPGSINTKTEDELGWENHRMFLDTATSTNSQMRSSYNISILSASS